MLNLQSAVQFALIISTGISVLQNFGSFSKWFVVLGIGCLLFQWALSQPIASEAKTQAEDMLSAGEESEPVDYFPEVEEELIDTVDEVFSSEIPSIDFGMSLVEDRDDLWNSLPQQVQQEETVGEAEPTKQPDEPTATTIKVPSDPLNSLIQQLESLPQKKDRRKTWSGLCRQLNVMGAAKVRDAATTKKAQYLLDKGILATQVVKAKVHLCTLAS